MTHLEGKFALVTGIANKRSIAFAVAQALVREGAELALAYLPLGREGELEKFTALTAGLNPALVLPLDVTDPRSARALLEQVGTRWGKLHFLLHAIASAKREELGGRTSDISQEGYLLAQQVSSYSLIELVREARGLLAAEGGSVVTLTYIGSERVANNYNVMGMAKAGLEASVRHLAMVLGEEAIGFAE